MSKAPCFFILAGEASGDSLGAEVMQACSSHCGAELNWIGMGGAKMQALGLNSSDDYAQLSIMGFSAAIQALPKLNRLADNLITTVMQQQPKVIFTIDSKGFSLRFAKKLRSRLRGSTYQPKLIHMVAPTVWAWGGWRAAAFEKVFDAILCLFPFEPAYFNSKKVQAKYVGHPLGWKISATHPPLDILKVALLPGSRKSEISKLLPYFLEAGARLHQQLPKVEFVLPTFSHLKDDIQSICSDYNHLPLTVRISENGEQVEWQDCHIICAASGTVTLEAALAGMPGVTAYHLSVLNRMMKWLLYKPHTPVLPDILLDANHYPCFLPPHLTADNLAMEMQNIIEQYRALKPPLNDASRELKQMLTQGQADFQTSLIHAVGEFIGS